jgi:hypothetical protein
MHNSINVEQQSAYSSHQNTLLWPYSSTEVMGSPTEETAICFRVILINPHFVTCDNIEKEMWVCMKVFPDRMLLLLVNNRQGMNCALHIHIVSK